MKQTYVLVITLASFLVACGGGDKATKSEPTTIVPVAPARKTVNFDSVVAATAQNESDTVVKVAYPNYRASATIVNALVHTKLEVSFDWKKHYMYGKAEIKLKPYFYPTDTLVLDAKGFDLNEVSMLNGKDKTPLKYTYDSRELHIKLGRTYKKDEEYVIYIDYTSKPDELKDEKGGSAAITSHKGLFFINANDSDKTKPRELWTQGETEDNSCWFPTIDKPDQRMTEEIYMTIEKDFKTLSNGALLGSVENRDGTRTDHWSMELGIPPYLVMMAAGPFAIVHDSWRGKPVDYYVDKKYEPYAKDIFGRTPQMIELYSRLLKFPYVWNKYDQVIAHDYVSGAMENTTATLHGEFVQRTHRELIDNNLDNAEDVICHELFHHWFGDLVTCESWSNISLNESFATYGEYLWRQYEYSTDEADQLLQMDMGQYINNSPSQHNLVDFYYNDREDLFDLTSYQKGGCILHMLRCVVGDSAFFDALHLYLETNKFTPVESQELRLAFEKVTGQDLNWFFNEWFYDKGYPIFEIKHSYDDSKQEVTVTINQTQDLTDNPVFKMPVYIDVYFNGIKESHKVVISKNKEKFVLHAPSKPDWVDVDAQKMLLCTKNEEMSLDERKFEYTHGQRFLARFEALRTLSNRLNKPGVRDVMMTALHDRFWYLRRYAINKMDGDSGADFKAQLIMMAKADSSSLVRADAINILAKDFKKDMSLMDLYKNALKDSSYAVESEALNSIAAINKDEALTYARQFESSDEPDMLLGVAGIYSQYGGDENSDFFAGISDKVSSFEPQILYVALYGQFIKRCNDDENVSKGVDVIAKVYKHGSSRLAKFYARSSLQQIVAWFQDKEGSLNEQIAALQKNNPADAQIAVLQTKMAKDKAQEQRINALMAEN